MSLRQFASKLIEPAETDRIKQLFNPTYKFYEPSLTVVTKTHPRKPKLTLEKPKLTLENQS